MFRQRTSNTRDAAERSLARQRPPAREVLDEESERRRKRRSMAAAAAARAGGALSLTAVLLGTPALALPGAAAQAVAAQAGPGVLHAAAAPTASASVRAPTDTPIEDSRGDAATSDADQ